jgi:UDP-N-acetyl-D-glucosamine/UDP-N-acetyl-D-galactosamine dehydrogenase
MLQYEAPETGAVLDLRNWRVIDLIRELETYGVRVVVHDPVVSREDAVREYGIELADMGGLAGGERLGPRRRAQGAGEPGPAGDFMAKVARSGCLIDVKSRLDAER